MESILYVEDDAAQARLVRRCLERAGYDVTVAGDGETGLVFCKDRKFSAVIVDQTMPGISGLDVIRELTARGPLPPMVMVTGTGDEKIAVEVMKLGVSDYLVKDSEGGFINVLPLVVGRVIEQRRTMLDNQRMEKELAQAQKMRSIGQLAAGIAHEINTPTQYIGNNARFLQDAFSDISDLLDVYERLLQAAENHSVSEELLQEVEHKRREADIAYLTAEIPQAIQQSLEGVEHVANIVGAMKEFSHPDAGRKQPVDLKHLIEGAVVICQNEWKYVANVVTDFGPGIPLVYCLSSEINRVMLNLLVNAAHATADVIDAGREEKRDILVSTRRDGAWAEIRVSDKGSGIPADIREHVFDLFFTTKDVGRGSGQGLSITHTIVVENHGGTINFETEVGQGTTFIVRLPIDGQPKPNSEEEAEQVETVGAGL